MLPENKILLKEADDILENTHRCLDKGSQWAAAVIQNWEHNSLKNMAIADKLEREEYYSLRALIVGHLKAFKSHIQTCKTLSLRMQETAEDYSADMQGQHKLALDSLEKALAAVHGMQHSKFCHNHPGRCEKIIENLSKVKIGFDAWKTSLKNNTDKLVKILPVLLKSPQSTPALEHKISHLTFLLSFFKALVSLFKKISEKVQPAKPGSRQIPR